MNPQDLDSLLRDVDWWQIWEIAPGVFTPGKNDVRRMLDFLEFPSSLAGKRVLDIGGWNGCFSFECERRGAAEVVMVEPMEVEVTGFHKIRQFLSSNVRLVSGTIYDLDPKWLGHFDVVLCFGVIYHLRYPLLGLDNIRRVCKGDLYVESAVLDGSTWTPKGGLQPLRAVLPELEDLPFIEFFAHSEFFNDNTNWFVPNTCATNAMFEAAGFDVVRYKCDGRYYGYFRLRPGEAPMLQAAHEGMSYDIHSRSLLGDRSLWPLVQSNWAGIGIEWGEGYYGLEFGGFSTWRWSGPRGVITLTNNSQEPGAAGIRAAFSTGHANPAELKISGLISKELQVTSTATVWSTTLTVPPGVHQLIFECDAAPVDAPHDPRVLVFMTRDFGLSY